MPPGTRAWLNGSAVPTGAHTCVHMCVCVCVYTYIYIYIYIHIIASGKERPSTVSMNMTTSVMYVQIVLD